MKAILIITAVFPPEPIVSSKLSFDITDKLSVLMDSLLLKKQVKRVDMKRSQLLLMCVHNLN